jgi:hypothetical protein
VVAQHGIGDNVLLGPYKTPNIAENMKFPSRGRLPARRIVALLLNCQCLMLAACEAPVTAADESAAADTLAPGCIADGQLSVQLYGSVRTTLAWEGAELECDGMIRPEDEGARLRFAGPLPAAEPGVEQRSLAIIFGIPDLREGETARELPTNVTFIEEGVGRFFSTQDTDSCWTDVMVQERITAGGPAEYRIGGVLYCVAPLAELNGSSSINFTDIEFTGRLSWEFPE